MTYSSREGQLQFLDVCFSQDNIFSQKHLKNLETGPLKEYTFKIPIEVSSFDRYIIFRDCGVEFGCKACKFSGNYGFSYTQCISKLYTKTGVSSLRLTSHGYL